LEYAESDLIFAEWQKF